MSEPALTVDGLDIDYSGLSQALREGVQLYIEHHLKPGDFVCAVLANDLRETCARADFWNLRRLPEIVAWFHDHAPTQCWGSREKVSAWLAKGDSAP